MSLPVDEYTITRIARLEAYLDGKKSKIIEIAEVNSNGDVVDSQRYLEQEDGTVGMSITACDVTPILVRPEQDRQCNIRFYKTNCRNCGAPLTDRQCQYCGTKYQVIRNEPQ